MKISQEKIDRAHKISKRILEIGINCLFALLFSMLLKPLLAMLGVVIEAWACYPAICLVYKVLGAIFGITAILGLIPTMILSLWATDDEKQQRKEEIKEAVREMNDEDKQSKRRLPEIKDVKSPLVGLTPVQEGVIIEMLRKIETENGHLKTSKLKNLLLALKAQGDLDGSNMMQVIAWVEQSTGEKVDERNFKHDYQYKTSDKEITKWGDLIRAEFDKL